MRKIFLIAVSGLLLTLATGCGWRRHEEGGRQPTETELRNAEQQRDRIKKRLRGLQQLIRTRDHEDIMRKFVYRGTTPDIRYANYAAFKRATWIPELSGYQLTNLDEVLGRLHWWDLNYGRVSFSVEATCTRGRRWEDGYHLFRPEGEWLVTRAQLRSPDPGSIIELAAEDKEDIISLLGPLFEKFGENNLSAIMDVLPTTYEARYREEQRIFWVDRLPWVSGETRAIKEDIKGVLELSIENWPPPSKGFPAEFAGDMSAALSYNVSYPARGYADETETIKLIVYVRENEDREWELRKLRFYGHPQQ